MPCVPAIRPFRLLVGGLFGPFGTVGARGEKPDGRVRRQQRVRCWWWVGRFRLGGGRWLVGPVRRDGRR